MTQSRLTLIIPAYNEEASLPALLPRVLSFCKKHKHQLILVNDGSSDQTDVVLRKFSSHPNLTILRHKVNKGYGAAIKSALTAAKTTYCITLDSDGQHDLKDVERLYRAIQDSDADLIVGSRLNESGNTYRQFGKSLIRLFAKCLMPLSIHDLNSGMKIYRTELAKKYLHLCPDSMAYSDTIVLVFIHRKHLVQEIPITIHPRIAGESTINTLTAIETVKQILNLVVLFNPIRIFFPFAIFFFVISFAWGLPVVLRGRGVSVGAMLGMVTSIFFFFFGLVAEQLSLIRKEKI